MGSKAPAPPTIQRSGMRSPDATEKLDENMEDVTEEGHRSTEGSFHSANEDQTTKLPDPGATMHEQDMNQAKQEDGHMNSATQPEEEHRTTDPDLEEIGSPSDESTPDRPLVRKSSLTFAALPARDPLKTSLGARISRTSHVEQSRQLQTNMYSGPTAASARQSEQQLMQSNNQDADMKDFESDVDDENVEILGRDDSDEETQTVQTHSKSSTQRLHEKIDMLGKAHPPRPSKSIHSAVTVATTKLNEAASGHAQPANDDEDDWIKPLTSPNAATTSPAKSSATENGYISDEDEEFDIRAPELIAHEERMKSPVRMSPGPGKIMPGYGHTKSASTATLASPAKAAMAPPTSPQKSISVSNPSQATTTPRGSPKRYLDLSASKSKLQSIMKTAKGLFTSSASVSAAAKLETLSPNALKAAASAMPGMYPNLNGLIEDKPLPASPPRQARKTRSSTEREKEEKRKEKENQLMQRMDDQLEEAREKERRRAAVQKQAQEQAPKFNRTEYSAQASPKRHAEDHMLRESIETAPPVGRGGRPVRPVREPTVNKTKPAPVSIRVGTLSQRVPPGASHASGNPQEVLNAEPKRPGFSKKASTASLQSATSNALKASVHSQPAKPRALLAAERKKEQDEREAQRKLEQKREIERKRAAQQEEARKLEQKQRAEAEKRERERLAAEQAKRQAQQQAIERKRQETARKAEQQRLERAANEAVSTLPLLHAHFH